MQRRRACPTPAGLRSRRRDLGDTLSVVSHRPAVAKAMAGQAHTDFRRQERLLAAVWRTV
jgi:hypothetical protein